MVSQTHTHLSLSQHSTHTPLVGIRSRKLVLPILYLHVQWNLVLGGGGDVHNLSFKEVVNSKALRRKHSKNLLTISMSNFFLDTSPQAREIK